MSDTSSAQTQDSAMSLQERYAPAGVCFGCGVANPRGLQIRSHATESGDVVATWRAETWHEAWEGCLSGGVAGALLDCHSNWTAAYSLMQAQNLSRTPNTVTADFHVRLLRPTPTDGPITLRARAVEVSGDRAIVESSLEAGGKVCATCRGTFVAVKEGHPAFGRW